MKAIKIVNLTKAYKDIVAVDNLNLEINEFELFSLLGVNGAGKTTTIKMLSCLTNPTSGDAIVMNHSILTEKEEVKNIIDLSTQETSVAKNLTVKENLEFYGSIYGIDKIELNSRINDLLDKFDLRKYKDKKASQLSGGYMRKLSIAMALVSKPKVLFLDEPTLGLDVLSRRDLWDIINEIKKTTTIILTTHYLEEAEALSDRIGIMVNGKLIKCGTASELKKSVNEDNFEEAFIKIVRGSKNA